MRHPLNASDMSSYLLQAQSSGAQYVALASSGSDAINAVKQARGFRLTSHGQQMVGIVVFLTDLKAMGLEAADGLVFSTGFTAGASPEAAAWSRRFFERHHAMPNDAQAGVYSATLHYLEAVKDADTDESSAIMTKMRGLPVEDMFTKHGVLRADGQMVHDMYLVQAKKQADASDPWDLVRIVQIIPGEEAFRPLSDSGCPLIQQSAK
jgi:branched-chain amino acid transport system substrate-binding protein